MSQFWSRIARELSPYVPGEQPKVDNLIKLNTNEHPEAPAESVLTALANVTSDALRRYPDPESSHLRSIIAKVEKLEVDQVFVGNGSDEVLAHVFQGLISARDAFVVPDITYSFYPVWASLYGLQCCTVPLTDGFTLDVAALCAFDGPVLIANPNAPTGIALDIDDLRRLAASDTNRLVVVDEAYFGFGAPSAVSLINEYPNVLVTRSLSKSHALAGLRVGYALGSPALIEGLVRVKDSFNSYPLDAFAQAGAAAAIADTAWFEAASAEVIASREWLTTALESLGFDVCQSQANFVFARHSSVPGKTLFDHLRQEKILVRRWDKPRIADHLRITVGTRSQCETLIDTLARFLSN